MRHSNTRQRGRPRLHIAGCRKALLALVGLVGALALFVVSPAGGVIGGTYDGVDHPFVGSLVITMPDGTQVAGCTGTLIAPTVFETAGHCIAFSHSVWGVGDEPSNFAAVFDPEVSYDGSGHILNAIPAKRVYLDPEFGFRAGNGWANPHDMGVLILDHAPPGIAPARVPEVGEFDHIAHSATFTVVGRGTSQAGSGPCPLAPMTCGTRYTTTLRFKSLRPYWVQVSIYPSLRDEGRLANGDSGSPFFLDGVDPNTVVGTYTGGRTRAEQYAYRLDTQVAHDFLDPFLSAD